jgi:transcriptional regulator with XRE-family HTH domain
VRSLLLPVGPTRVEPDGEKGVSEDDAASLKGMGLAVSELRKRHELSQSALARRAGMGVSTLYEIEQGKSDARWGTLRLLASALEVPLEVMIKRAGQLAPDNVTEAGRDERGGEHDARG